MSAGRQSTHVCLDGEWQTWAHYDLWPGVVLSMMLLFTYDRPMGRVWSFSGGRRLQRTRLSGRQPLSHGEEAYSPVASQTYAA